VTLGHLKGAERGITGEAQLETLEIGEPVVITAQADAGTEMLIVIEVEAGMAGVEVGTESERMTVHEMTEPVLQVMTRKCL